jgi:hypothetical protein
MPAGRPRKNIEQKKLEGTYRKDRDIKKKNDKLLEMENALYKKFLYVDNELNGLDIKKDKTAYKNLIGIYANIIKTYQGISRDAKYNENENEDENIVAKMIQNKKS